MSRRRGQQQEKQHEAGTITAGSALATRRRKGGGSVTRPLKSSSTGSPSALSSSSTSSSKRGHSRKQPVREDYATDAEFEEAFQHWRELRDRNNAAVVRSRQKQRERKKQREQQMKRTEEENVKLERGLSYIRERLALIGRAVESPESLEAWEIVELQRILQEKAKEKGIAVTTNPIIANACDASPPPSSRNLSKRSVGPKQPHLSHGSYGSYDSHAHKYPRSSVSSNNSHHRASRSFKMGSEPAHVEAQEPADPFSAKGFVAASANDSIRTSEFGLPERQGALSLNAVEELLLDDGLRDMDGIPEMPACVDATDTAVTSETQLVRPRQGRSQAGEEFMTSPFSSSNNLFSLFFPNPAAM